MNKNSPLFLAVILAMGAVTFGTPVVSAQATTPITLAQIAQHNTAADCWTAISGNVYDLTSYISSHPGGSTVAVICGIDGTQAFMGQHPASYLSMISSYQIGVLVTPDTTPPVITVLGSNPVTVSVNSTYVDAGATATDNVDGNLTSSIAVTNPVNTAVAGTYTVTYIVTDRAGNSATATRTVIVRAPSGTGSGTGGGDHNGGHYHGHDGNHGKHGRHTESDRSLKAGARHSPEDQED